MSYTVNTTDMAQKIKILIVDDDPRILQMYEFKFTTAGFEVKAASDGAIGLQLAQSFAPEIILLDLRMPVMAGDEMLEKLRSHEWGSNIRVIIMTNISRDEAPGKLRFLGVDRYIVKAHHTPAQILDTVHELYKK